MKRHLLAFLILIIFLQPINAALPTGAVMFDVNVPALCGGPTIGLSAIHWETSSSQYDYVLTYPSVFDPLNTLPFIEGGQYRHLTRDPAWDLKLNIGYIFPGSGNDLTLSYVTYHQGTRGFVTLNTLNAILLPSLTNEWPTSTTLTIFSPFLNQETFNVPSALVEPNVAAAKLHTNFNVFDFDYGQFVNVGCRTRLKFTSGIRYVDFCNKLDVTYQYFNVDETDIALSGAEPTTNVLVNFAADFNQLISQTSDYNGVGPHFGVDLSYYLDWGFGFVSHLSSSLLVGNNDANLSQQFTRTAQAIVVASNIDEIVIGEVFSNSTEDNASFNFQKTTRIVPNIDAKIGIDYSIQFCNKDHSKLTFEIGYLVDHYFNMADQLSEVGVDAPQSRSIKTHDVHFEGFYLSVMYNL